MTEKQIAVAVQKAIKELKPPVHATNIAEGGSRNPWASFNVITEKGSVYRIEVKRLVA